MAGRSEIRALKRPKGLPRALRALGRRLGEGARWRRASYLAPLDLRPFLETSPTTFWILDTSRS